ncbi:MAG TPA: hypothetical protein VG321_04895 [Solirubrobacteraceae bacterium]|jgi:hypothetical protein|nr:hypothetical protein [Solirubrobacteraceae bacterium]
MDERRDAFPAGLAATDELAAEATEEPIPEVTGEGPLEELVELEAEIEVVDGLPVVSSRREVARSAAALPAVQTAAAAATGFMVGAATLALLRRRDSRRLTRELRDLRGRLEPRRPPEPPMEPGQSYLVHVRVFSRPGHDPRG